MTQNHRMLPVVFTLCLLSAALPAHEFPPHSIANEAPPATAQPPATAAATLPLKATRKLEFTTDEGTWISLDVSPDGKTVLFELNGQLYTVPFTGGQARRLTDGSLAFNSQPRYSPDGQLIAFLSDRDGSENVWTMQVDGSNLKNITKQKMFYAASLSWTPDSQFIIAGDKMYGLKGGAGLTLPALKTVSESFFDAPPKTDAIKSVIASRDGRYFYYSKAVGSLSDLLNVEFPRWQIARRDRFTGDEVTITRAPGNALRPALSADGKWLAYGSRRDGKTGLKLMNLDTRAERWLHYPIQRDAQEGGEDRDTLPSYTFTPDDREIVIAFDGKIQRVDVATGAARIIPFTAHVSQDMGPALNFPVRVEDGPTVQARIIQNPVQSPDGRRLAFSALSHLYVMDLPNGKPKRLTQEAMGEFQPAWSPDGKSLTFVSWTTEGGQLWKVSANGGKPQALTRARGAYYRDPVWSPDGSRVVALRGTREGFLTSSTLDLMGGAAPMDLVWVAASGGDLTTIVPSVGASRPHFGPQQDRIYVNSERQLISVRWDGSDRRTHFKFSVPGMDFSVPREARISPDGKRALILTASQLYVAELPQIGSLVDVSMQAPSVALKKLTDIGANYFAWSNDGATVTWSVGSRFFRMPLSAVNFEPAPPTPGQTPPPPGTPDPTKLRTQEKPPVENLPIVLEKPRYRPRGTVVLSGARAITMKGDEIIADADIVITDNRITAIGARGSIAIPAGTKIIDLNGTTVVPGFIDLHAHLWDIGHGLVEPQNWNFLAELAYGVTTSRDVQTLTNDLFVYQDLVETGEMIGPRTHHTGPGIFAENRFQSAEEAYNVIARYKDYYRTHFIKSYAVGNRQQRQWVAQACEQLKVMPTTEGAVVMKMDMTHALDGFSGNEHALPIVPLYRDLTQLFAQSGITETPTLIVTYGGPQALDYFMTRENPHTDAKLRRFTPHSILDEKTERRKWFRDDQFSYPQVAASAGKIIKDGGRIGIGAHGELHGLGYHWEMWALASGSVSRMDVLRAATLHGAQGMGYEQDLGSLEPGKLADLVILNKNPLDDIRNTNTVRYVMKDGTLYEGDSLNEIWPRQKPLPPLWFTQEP